MTFTGRKLALRAAVLSSTSIIIFATATAHASFRRVAASSCRVTSGQSVTYPSNMINDSWVPAAGSGANHAWYGINYGSISAQSLNTQITCPIPTDSTFGTSQFTGAWVDALVASQDDGNGGFYGGAIANACTTSYDGSTIACAGQFGLTGSNACIALGFSCGYVSRQMTGLGSFFSNHPYDYPYLYVAMGNPPGYYAGPAARTATLIGFGIY